MSRDIGRIALGRLTCGARDVVWAVDHDDNAPVAEILDGVVMAAAELRLAFTSKGGITRRIDGLAVSDPDYADALDDLATMVEVGLEQIAQLATRAASLKEARS